jgi:ADP-ribosylglycohydrolase
MRSAILGAAVSDREQLRSLVHASTRLTHTDPKAEYGAFAVALAARLVGERPEIDGAGYLTELRAELPPEAAPLLASVERVVASVGQGESTAEYAHNQGWKRGVSGYVYHTVPVALHAWLSHPHDYAQAVQAVILAGGDTDTTAAITGGIVGAAVGRAGIPEAWLARLAEWPRTVAWMDDLAERLAEGREPPRLSGLATLARNGFFFAVVLAHILRRLLPPY